MNVEIGWSDIFMFSVCCYLRAKELGYNNITIVFPSSPYTGDCQDTKYLPWRYYSRDKEINENEWDKIIDITKDNSFFNGYVGSGFFWQFYQYLSMYYFQKGETPCLNIKRTYNGKPYVLFHFRGVQWNKKKYSLRRNTKLEKFEYMFHIIKEKLGDEYQYWKIGEPCKIDNKFDKVIKNNYDIDKFAKLIRNCSLLVSGDSGPPGWAMLFDDIPFFGVELVWNITPANKRIWSAVMHRNRGFVNDLVCIVNRIVVHFPFLCDALDKLGMFLPDMEYFFNWCEDRYMRTREGKLPDEKKIEDFLGRNNLCCENNEW